MVESTNAANPFEVLIAEITAAASWDAPARQRLVARLTALGQPIEALHLAAPGEAEAAATLVMEGFNAQIAAGDLAAAERHAAALTAYAPGNFAVLEAALACNRNLGHQARARHFARQMVALEPDHVGAHLVLLEAAVASGDAAGELASRTCLAVAPAGAIHPLRRLHEAHRAISLHLLHPLDAARAAAVQALVLAARQVEPDALPEGEARHWARHYRHLAEAADQELLGGLVEPVSITAIHRAFGRAFGWPQLRRQAACRTAKLAFVVAADAAYLRLYGRAYLSSILRHCEVPALVVVHVIGGQRELPQLIRLMDLDDARILFTTDDFVAAAVTTQCHDSDGPRRLPVAHFQSTRFAVARRVMQELRLPVFVSDIDCVLQRGVGDLVERFAASDIVLNRNAASDSFGSHITANLLLAFPTDAGHAFLAELQGYLEGALTAPHVTRWIDQTGLQLCWNRHAAAMRFGWFDTQADINNVMYPRWQPNPFRFLSLFHGFDMASLPRAA